MKKYKPLVSILIVNYNNEKLLSRAITSCLMQTYKNIEITIYDDASTDKSVIKIKKFLYKKNIKFYLNSKKKSNIASFDAMNGYLFLFKKSKGSIICLLDSDDYYHNTKVAEVVKYFESNKKTQFLQNLPTIIKDENILFKKNKNNFFSFWRYLAPESCVSFRRNFLYNFIKNNKILKKKYEHVWFAFRMGVFSYFVQKSFGSLEKNLTYYQSLGQSKKYLFMSYNWFLRRKQSLDYLKKISLNFSSIKFFIDYVVTFLISKLLRTHLIYV